MRLTEAEYEALCAKRSAPPSAEREQCNGVVATAPEKRSAARFVLPWPPSTNTIWRSLRSGPMAGRVLLSKAGRQYREAVADAVVAQNTGRVIFGGRVGVEIILHPPTRRKLDIDNRVKALLDGLTHVDLWHDDEQIDVLIVRREEIRKEGAAIVVAWEIEE